MAIRGPIRLPISQLQFIYCIYCIYVYIYTHTHIYCLIIVKNQAGANNQNAGLQSSNSDVMGNTVYSELLLQIRFLLYPFCRWECRDRGLRISRCAKCFHIWSLDFKSVGSDFMGRSL